MVINHLTNWDDPPNMLSARHQVPNVCFHVCVIHVEKSKLE